MKPIVKKKLAVFHPQGFLDGGNARGVIEPQDISFLSTTKCEVILVSLKKIIFFNRRGLSTVLESLQVIGNKLGAMIGFCDYDDKKFKMVIDMYNGHVPFSLLDTESIGGLFASSSNKEAGECKILVFNDDVEQRNKISMELYELGYKPTIAKSYDEYESLKDESYEYIIRNSHLGSIDRAIQIHIKDNVVVYSLKDFLDSTLADDFDMEHHNNALKIGFNYYLFEASKVASTNVHAVNFIAKLSTAGAEHGATIAICGLTEQSITEPLKNDLEDSGVLIYEDLDSYFSDDELFGEDGGGALSGKKPKNITKKLVEILPLIMETTIKTIESMTHGKLDRKSTTVKDLELVDTKNSFAVAIAFYGQAEGMMVLSFDEVIAKKACAVLLDENSNRSELMDALCELINIIGGKLVQHLTKKNLHVNITMPRAYKNANELLAHKKGTKGAQVDFEMDGKSVVLFLTK